MKVAPPEGYVRMAPGHVCNCYKSWRDAAVASGDPEALRIANICKSAGLKILKGPVQFDLLKPGQISFATALGKIASRFGEDITIKALRAVVAAGAIITSVIAVGVVEVLNDHPEWAKNEAALRSAFERVDLDEMLRLARSKAVHLKGTSATDQFESLLIEALTRVFGPTAEGSVDGQKSEKAEKRQVSPAQPLARGGPEKPAVPLIAPSFGVALAVGRDHIVFRGKRLNVSPRAAILVTALANARPNCVGDAFLIAKMWTSRPLNADVLLESIVTDLSAMKKIGLEIRSHRGIGRQLVELGA